MKHFKIKHLAVFFVFFAFCMEAGAVPASRKAIKTTQVDGSTLTILIHGDENLSWITTLDGYSIQRNAEGFFEYVSRIENNRPVLSGIRAQEPDERKAKTDRFLQGIPKGLRPQRNPEKPVEIRAKGFPRQTDGNDTETGSPQNGNPAKGSMADADAWQNNFYEYGDQSQIKGVLVPVNFPDCPLTYSQEEIEGIMNEPGYDKNGAKGSVHDYFDAMSQGKFNFHIEVLPPITAYKNRDGYDRSGDHLKAEVYRYVLSVLGDTWVDYDLDRDGYIDHISILFAGMGQEIDPSNTMLIWSHNGYTTYDVIYRNTNISLIAEIDNRDGVQGIETYCHEFGHALGLPDFYDTEYSGGDASRPDQHELMSANTASGHPVPMSAFSRWILGWTGFKTLSAASPGDYELQDMLQEPTAWRYYTQSPGEFFLIENRSLLNTWQDREDLGHGMLVFRVDSARYMQGIRDNTVNNEASRLAFQLLRADNDNSYDSPQGDYFPNGGLYTEFSDQSTPSSLSYAGTATGLPLTGITENENIIRFNFAGQGQSILAATLEAEETTDWGYYRVEGAIVSTQGAECREAGICYSLLPLPTTSGNKVVATEVPRNGAFEIDLDLSSFVENARINYRAYALDGQGNTVYGSVKQIQLPAKRIRVETEYEATMGNGGIQEEEERLYTLKPLDLSGLQNPVIDFYGPDLWIGGNGIENAYLQVSPDGGKTWKTLHPDGLSYPLQNNRTTTRLSFLLPEASANYQIRFIGDIYNDHKAVVRSGNVHDFIPMDSALYFASEAEGGNYTEQELSEDAGFYKRWELRSVNTTQASFPVARFKLSGGNNNSGEDLVLVKTGSERLYQIAGQLKDRPDYCYTNSNNYMDYDWLYKSGSNIRTRSKEILPTLVVPLPVDECVQLLFHSAVEVEVTDLGDSQGLAIQELRAIDLNTVEIEGINLWQNEQGLALFGEERGICWNTENTPSTANKVELPAEEYFLQALPGLPGETLWFWTYRIDKNGTAFSEKAWVSEVSNGQRTGLILQDSLNPITPLGRTADGMSAKLRVVYPPALLEGAIAQGICHDWNEPDINTHPYYHEGNIVTTEYYTLPYSETGYQYNVRPFTMKQDGSITYGRYIEIKTCAPDEPALDGEKYVLAAPCDLVSEAARTYEDGSNGTRYWRPHGMLSYNEYDQSLRIGGGNYAYGDKVISPALDLSACLNPMLNLRLFVDANHYYGGFERIQVSVLDAMDGREEVLDTLVFNYENDPAAFFQIPLRSGSLGDTLHLCFEKLTFSSQGIKFLEMNISDQLSPQVSTLAMEDSANQIRLHGNLQSSPAIPEATEYGFLYSRYGDPLAGMENHSWSYQKVEAEGTDAAGNFSAVFTHDYLDYLYARAYATNENGTSYGECTQLLHCGDYVLSAESLPVTDPMSGQGYNEDGSTTSIFPFYSCQTEAGYSVFRTGLLQLVQAPELHKIHAKVEWEVIVPGSSSAVDDPENSILPYFEALFRTGNASQWSGLPEGYTLVHTGNHFLIPDGWRIVFELEADFPRSYSQMELRLPDYWDFSINSIEYSESEQVDNYVPVPYISRLGVEEGHISLYWGIDSWDMVSAVRVYREGSTSGSWNMVQEYTSGPVSPILQQHIDYTSAPATRAYRYEVRSVNSEGVEFASTQHRSIHLTINKGIQNQWNLMWNAYEGREVEAVTIYRGGDAASLEAIDQITGNSYSYTDVSAPEGDVYYQIETHFATRSKAKDAGESSRSNIATNVESTYYTLQILPSENGQVRVSREGQEVLSGSVFEEGTRLDMEATADPGYRFGQWMDGNTENPRYLFLVSDLEVSATFVPEVSNQGNPKVPSLELYPNPVKDILHVSSACKLLYGEIRNLQGKTLFRFEDKENMEIPMSGFPAGIYVFHYATPEGQSSTKIVKF